MKSIVPLILCAVALMAAAPAHAVMEVAGSGEPAYTNTTTNTQWVSWQAPGVASQYRLRVTWYENNAQVHQETTPSVGPSGTLPVDWAGVRPTLTEGKTYRICVQGQYTTAGSESFTSDGDSCAHGSIVGKRTSTTIDLTKPTLTTTLAGGAAAVKSATIGIQVGFQDNLAGPFPANYLCIKAVQAGAADPPPDCAFAVHDACSIPGSSTKDTTFGCQADVSSLPDGPVAVCVIGADSAVPDKPSSSSQSGTSNFANLSTAACDRVTLDRAAPTVAISSSKSTATAGETISFSSQASDATSGLTGTGSWQFGDGATGTGAAAEHSFAQAGTYTVRYSVDDGAGNTGTAEKVVTVTAPSTGNPGTPDPGTQNPGTPGTQNPGTQNPGTPDPGTQNPGPTPAPGSVQVGSVWVLAPKRFRIGSSRRLSVSVGASQAGQLTLTLVRGKKTIARLGVGLSPGATKQVVKLPKKLAAGTYSLKVGFKPSGVTWTASGTAKIAFQAAKKKKR